MLQRQFIIVACMAAGILTACTDPRAPQYESFKLPAPAGKVGKLIAQVLNDKGEVAGIFCEELNRCKPFFYANGVTQIIDLNLGPYALQRADFLTNNSLVVGHYQTVSGYSSGNGKTEYGTFTFANGKVNSPEPSWPIKDFWVSGINDRGDAYGFAPGGASKAFTFFKGELRFLFDEATYTPINFLTSKGLNQNGQFAGKARESASPLEYVFIFSDGGFRKYKTNDKGFITTIYSINDIGDFVGQMQSFSKGFQAFIAQNGDFEMIDVGKNEAHATGVNNDKVVVGYGYNSIWQFRFAADAFVWKKGATYSLSKVSNLSIDPDGVEYRSKLNINNRGQIIVQSRGSAYMLTPGRVLGGRND